MKKFWAAFILIVCALFISIPASRASAQDVQNFTISSFAADYRLGRNADKTALLDVTERIIAKFPDFDQNHGILRAIPQRYQNHTLSLQVDSVLNDKGTPWSYTTYKQNDNLVLKIGDADRFVHGEQTYTISYSMRNVANLLADHNEFYWDVNGNQWPQRFGMASARIHVPKELASQLQDRQVCYAGPTGSTDQTTCQISRDDNDNETVFRVSTTNGLNPYETLTFAIALNIDTFAQGPEIAREQLMRKVKYAAMGAAVALPPAVTLAFMFRRWRQFGDDPKGRGIIIPEYEPPKGLTSLTSDYILQQKMRNLACSAAIIELAVKRYLTIYETKKKKRLQRDASDYQLELNKLPDDLPNELKQAVKTLFGSSAAIGAKVKMSELKKKATTGALRDDMKELEDSLANGLFTRGYFIKNPKKVRNGYLVWAGILAFAGGFLAFAPWTLALAVGMFLAAGVMSIFAFIMPARTELGVSANDALLGLRDYIRLAESERLKFGQSADGAEKIAQGSFDPYDPKMEVKLFESLLPYAMLFTLEKSWAAEFSDIYKEPPDWYHGNWAAFNTGYLAGSLSSFSAASSQTFVSPSSSSGSGFGGGGGSGGGGGGGGGGGW